MIFSTIQIRLGENEPQNVVCTKYDLDIANSIWKLQQLEESMERESQNLK
jgi:hypothetical protein